MNFQYGFPLLDKKDFKKAYNYCYNDDFSDKISIEDKEHFEVCKSFEMENYIVLRANMKIVQEVLLNKILYNLCDIFRNLEIKYGIVIFNPTIITSSRNPFVSNKILDRLCNEIVEKMYEAPHLWIYFNRSENKKLEQLIKWKYKGYSLFTEDTMFILLCPEGDFCFIYDFIDDIFRIY